jgi:hypothetical protein
MHKDKLKTGYDKTYSEQYDKVVWCEIDDNKYLGSLCKRKHNWNNTGKSLRYKSNGGCVECSKIVNLTPIGKIKKFLGLK